MKKRWQEGHDGAAKNGQLVLADGWADFGNKKGAWLDPGSVFWLKFVVLSLYEEEVFLAGALRVEDFLVFGWNFGKTNSRLFPLFSF